MRRRTSLRRLQRALTATAVGLSILSAAAAAQSNSAPQNEVLTGRVVSPNGPVGAVSLTLHRIAADSAGVAGQTVSDENGAFRFAFERPANAILLVTADHLAVRYLGPFIPVGAELPTGYSVTVYDTTSVLPEPIRVPSRNMILVPQPDGSWDINEVIEIINPSDATLVAPPGRPTWQVRIPEGATDFEASGDGGIAPSEVAFMGDRVMLVTAVPPGNRALWMRYRVPARPTDVTVPLVEPTDTFNLFVQQPSHLTSVEGLQPTRMVQADSVEYLQYIGTGFTPGASIALEWSGALSSPFDPVIVAVVVTLLLLGVGAWAAVRNRGMAPAP